ncbi:MAG TPA: hypothetical protein VLG76_00710 [Rhabdochlamydiaceae bacterium]|nr:hypothetical protein [Rhabdochlamydiaceae bacterium]
MSITLNKDPTIPISSGVPTNQQAEALHIQSALDAIKAPVAVPSKLVAAEEQKEDAKKYIEEYDLRHAICTYNGIKSSKNIEADALRSGAKQFSETLGNLPENIRKMIPEECLKMTIEAFKNASTLSILTANQKTVDDIRQGKLVLVPAGFKGHEFYLVFGLGYLFICNRGDRPDSTKMLQSYKIDTSRFSLSDLQEILQIVVLGTRRDFEGKFELILRNFLLRDYVMAPATDRFCSFVERDLSPKKDQKIGNCVYVNAKLASRLAVAISLNMKKTKLALSLGIGIVKNIKIAKKFSKAVSAHNRLKALDKYIAFDLENKELGLRDDALGKEAASLAIKHLKSNPELDLADYPLFKKVLS